MQVHEQINRTFAKLMRGTAAGRAMLAEGDKQLDAKRAEKARALVDLRAEFAKALPALVKAEQAARARVNEVLAELQAANGALRQAEANKRAIVFQLEHEERKLGDALARTAPRALALFASFLARAAQELQACPDPWGPKRPAIERTLDMLKASRELAAGLAEGGRKASEVRQELDEQVSEIRAQLEKLGGARQFTAVVLEGDPFDEAPEVVVAA